MITIENEIEFAELIAEKVMQKKMDRPLTQNEAFVFLGVSRPTLIGWRKKGFINGYKIGVSIYYHKADLLKCLKKMKPGK